MDWRVIADFGAAGLHHKQESHAVAGKPRDAAVNSDRYRVRWHFAGAIYSVSRMQSVSGYTVYA